MNNQWHVKNFGIRTQLRTCFVSSYTISITFKSINLYEITIEITMFLIDIFFCRRDFYCLIVILPIVILPFQFRHNPMEYRALYVLLTL